MQPSPSNNLLQHEVPKARRFSMLKFRHASDPQLNTKYREHAETGNNEPLPLMLRESCFLLVPNPEFPVSCIIPYGTAFLLPYLENVASLYIDH